MTIAGAVQTVRSWTEPDGVAPRGTLVVVPGRGEHAGVYERFGRRISGDGYRVHAVADPTVDEDLAVEQIRAALDGPAPHVLVGSDAGALLAAGLVATGSVQVDGLGLAGLPTGADGEQQGGGGGRAGGGGGGGRGPHPLPPPPGPPVRRRRTAARRAGRPAAGGVARPRR